MAAGSIARVGAAAEGPARSRGRGAADTPSRRGDSGGFGRLAAAPKAAPLSAHPAQSALPPARPSRWRKRLVALALTLAIGALIWSQLPKGGYSTDLARIGAGRPAVVLTQDANFLGGMAVMELMNVVREQHGDQVDFLVAHLSADEARRFAARQGSADGTVLLFAGDGRRVGVLHHPQSVDVLREAIVQAFELKR